MKRYIVFNCTHYYPEGGSDDIIYSSESLKTACMVCWDRCNDPCSGVTAHVYDMKREIKVFECTDNNGKKSVGTNVECVEVEEI